MKAIDAVQFALAPAEPVTFNTRKLRRKRKFFVRFELPSIIWKVYLGNSQIFCEIIVSDL